MKSRFYAILLAMLLPTSGQAFTIEGVGVEPNAQFCYGRAMVGFDSVINSRLGVAPEEVLHLAAKQVLTDEPPYSTYLLGVIFNAYLWEGAPHEYAVNVFFHCAKGSVPDTPLLTGISQN